MNVRIFYQDFALNALSFNEDSLILKPENAAYIWDMILESRGTFDWHDAETVYAHMNCLNVPPGHRHRKVFEAAGHTSMSVGDLIWIPDEKALWMVTAIGWQLLTKEELIKRFSEQVFNLFNGYGVRYENRAFGQRRTQS
jgi:hypothetical protein